MMHNVMLVWAIFAPVIAFLLSLLLLLLRRDGRIQRRVAAQRLPFFDRAALLCMCLGLLVEGPLLYWGASTTLLGLRLAVPSLALYPLLASNAALLCATFVAWEEPSDTGGGAYTKLPWSVLAPGSISALLALGLLVDAPVVQVLSFLCVALVAVAVAFMQVPLSYTQDDPLRTIQAQAIASGLKHLSVSTLGTGLLLVGALVLERYSLAMENTGLLQTGIALLAVGLLVRLGAMPFSAAYTDMLTALPAVSIMAMGAGTASILALGLLLFAPVQSSVLGSTLLLWLGPLSALLAGFRALSATHFRDAQNVEGRGHSSLIAMSVALSLAWAISGVLSGSEVGVRGATLLAANVALAVPLLLVSRRVSTLNARLSSTGTAVGALSLLGLPPFGGAPGTFLLAQTAAGIHGLSLAVLLLGSLLVASGWFVWAARHDGSLDKAHVEVPHSSGSWLTSPFPLLSCALIAAQLGLFFLR